MPTHLSLRSASAAAVRVLATTGVLLTMAVALAGPAAAIEDPRRPFAEITHGPSCGPGVVRVEVTNGTQARRVALVFDGAAEQDVAQLAAGEQTELASDDVDWGQTVDVSVSVTRPDGTTEAPIEFGTYTRPSAEDCAAVAPVALSSGTEPATRTSATVPTGGTDETTWGDDDAGAEAASASSASVAPGGVVTVRATGFSPGEPVQVTLVGRDGALTTVEAAPDGSVEAVVQIPRAAALGTATVQLVGAVSTATAGLDLQVAARVRPLAEQTTSVPVLAAGASLIGASGLLGLCAARRPRGAALPAPC
ncbi:hypothetical protein [Modestobacter excelsi]|uniref:hypothetical protein n=1 Tax=Modestobacter excelsi TaxID=2213161 RepID=UPI00110D09B1|nr:hypothetical protein [Modestobacter excelsi]